MVFKVEKLYDRMTQKYTFIVISMEYEIYQSINYYCERGRMENFIGEGKKDLGFQRKHCSQRETILQELSIRKHGYYKCHIQSESNCYERFRFPAVASVRLPALELNGLVCEVFGYYCLCGCPVSIFVPLWVPQ